MTKSLNKFSARVTQPRSQGASQAMLYGTGMTDEDMNKPQVGIASVWYEGNTCNMHLNALAAKVKEGVEAAEMVGMRFNTVGVSDGISMGTEGMSYSLQSRDLIADSLETVVGAQWYDALIALPGCDKNMPGCLMAMGRLNRPSIMVYGGTIRAGHTARCPKLDIVNAFQCYGEFIANRIDENERRDIVRHSIPGAGAGGRVWEAVSAIADGFRITTLFVLFAVTRTPSASQPHPRRMRRNAAMLGDARGSERDPVRGSPAPGP